MQLVVCTTACLQTVTHMPPELLLQGQMSKKVDVYSWGVLLWEMYCGCRPFAGMSHSQVRQREECLTTAAAQARRAAGPQPVRAAGML